MITSQGYHQNEEVKMDPETLNMGAGGSNDPFGGGEEEFESINLPPGALSDETSSGGGMPHQHYNSYSMQQQMYQQHHWNQYGMNGYGYHHQQQMDQSYYYSQQQQQQQPQQPPPQQQQQNNVYHQQPPSGMALPGGPSPVGSHNTPSPQAHSDDGDNDPHLRNNNVLKRPGEDLRYPGHHSMTPPYHHQQQPQQTQQQQHHLQHHHHQPPPQQQQQQLHHHHHSISGASKKSKVSKRKKKRDPNEPQKPVSAYALFFRDSQASIKAANPNAAFGDVSKIVASMWDGLDPDNKAAYKKRTENAKKEYLKKLAAYRASLVSKGSGGGSINESNHPPAFGSYGGYNPYGGAEPNNGIKPSPNESYNSSPGGTPGSSSALPYSNHHQQQQPIPPPPPPPPPRQQSFGPPSSSYVHHGQQVSNGGNGLIPHVHGGHAIPPPNHLQHHLPSENNSSSSSPQHSPPVSGNAHLDPQTGHLIEAADASTQQGGSRRGGSRLCARPGCNNPISSNSSREHGGGWGSNSEFCSNECVVGQCREVYSHWSSSAPPPNGQVSQQSQ